MSAERCPTWLPCHPDVPHADRSQCVLPPHLVDVPHVSEGHLEALNRADTRRGLYGKYEVARRFDPTGKHGDCRYFVLDPTHDLHARAALATYAASCEDDYPALAQDLRNLARGALSPAAEQDGDDR